jgi:Ferritin-like domain
VADTSTTAPPKQPTAADAALLSYALGLEFAMVDIYARAAAGAKDELKSVAELFGAHHRAAAQSLTGLLGRKAPTGRNEAFYAEQSKAASGGTAKDTAAHMAGLENAMVATHLKVLSTLRGIDGAALVASIIPIEARQAAVLVGLSGATALDDIMALDAEAAIDPETYPA